MAVQQLTQPIINPIAAFDSTKGAVVTFVVIGGAQVIGNRLIISDNQSGKQIYNQTQSTMKLEHAIPAGILSNGRYYNAVVRTIDNSGAESVASTAVPFYCYSQPSLTIDNIPTSETIENGTYKFVGSYLQSEGEALNSYQFTLYDSNKEVLSQTPLIYYEADSSLAYTFVGMSNDTSYYVSLTGETVNGTQITSGLKYFTVRYLQPASFAICDLVNDCDNGFIQISSNIVAIDGKSNPEPPIYIDNKEVDLRDPDSWVRWDEGFSIKNDFTMRVWGRDFTPYENIITLSNNLNSNNNPNKIEMKWMIGDTIKKLPSYSDADGYNVHLSNSKEAPISNLSIKGETRQKVDNGRVINKGEGYVTLNPASGKNKVDFINYVETIFDSSKVERLSDGSYKFEHCDTVYTLFKGLLKAPCTLSWYARNNGTGKSIRPTFIFKIFYEDGTIDTSNYETSPNFSLQTRVLTKNVIKIENTYIGTSPLTIIKDVQLEEGLKATSYEPFGYIPSNDFPCNISIIPGGNSIQETREESKSTVTGTEVTVNDTYINNQTKFNIDGNSYQETTEGYNIANLDRGTFTLAGVTVTNNGDGSFTFNGTSTNAADLILTKAGALNSNIYQFENAKYLLKTFVISGSISNPDNKVARITCMGRSNNTDNYGMLYNTLTQNIFSELFTMKITDTLGRIELYINSSGITFNNYTIKILLAKTDNVNLPYEPYTGGIPSPSPDYPSEITNVGEYDNLFDKNNIINGSYVSDGNGAFVSNSTSKRTDYIEIQANSYYYIYSDKTSGNWGAWYDKDKNFISGITLGGHKEGTANSPVNAKYIAFTISYQGNLTDYSKIKISETAIKIKQSGKNLFDKSTANIGKAIDASGNLATNSRIVTSDFIEVEANTNYFCSNVVGSNLARSSASYDENKTLIEIKSLQNVDKGDFKLLTPLKTKYIRVSCLADDIDVLQVAKGTEATPYEPYHEPIITPINLQGNTLSKIGDVKDILKINRNGEVEIKKNTWEDTINGSDLITLSNNNKGLAFYPSKKKTASLSDNDYLVTNAQRNTSHNDGTVYQNPVNFVFVGSPTDTLETIKAKFNGGKILYQLATPQIITLPSISPIELWQGTNIFSLVTNLETEIELEYNYIPQSPSPEAPSEIRNVGNNINIFNKNGIFGTNSAKVNVLDTGIRVTNTGTNSFSYVYTSLGGAELLGKNVAVHSDYLEHGEAKANINMYMGKSGSPTVASITKKNVNNERTQIFSIPSEFASGTDTINIVIYASYNSTGITGDYIDYNNLKVEISNSPTVFPTPYSEYEAGNITTVVSNENLGNAKQLYKEMYGFRSRYVRKEIVDNRECIVFNNNLFRREYGFSGLKGRYKKNTQYTIRFKARIYDTTITSGYSLVVEAFNSDSEKLAEFSAQSKGARWFQFSLTTPINSSLDCIAFSFGNATQWCLDMDSLEIYEGTSIRQVPKSLDTQIVFPLIENQLLYSGSELTMNGIYNIRAQVELTGTENWIPDAMGNNIGTTLCFRTEIDDYVGYDGEFAPIGKLTCTHFKEQSIFANELEGIQGGWGKHIFLKLERSNLSTANVDGFKAWLAAQKEKGTPVIVEYTTNSPYITKYTDEQSEIFNELFNVQTYLGQNNIFNLGSVPALLTAKTVETPTPITPSKVYSLGDIKNLIDALDKNVIYNQGYSDLITTNFKLKPNYIYTFSFEYEINEATTDLYYSVGYGIDNNYENSIVENLQYQNQTKGKNIVTFIVPKDIPSDKYLYFKIVQTEILANVDVNIFNIQLESGKTATEFQKNGLYNIYPTSTNKNIYNHNTPLYIKSNNIIYSELQNGYNIVPTSTSERTSLSIGYKGVLNEGDTYTISYQQMGQFDYFNLYITDKESQIPVRKLEVNNGTFVMPEGIYDLQLEFGVKNNSLNNSLEIWNVQIEANDKATEYEIHEENSSVITLDESINGFTAKKDLICLNSPNLLNNNTQSVNVKGDTPYYLNQKGNTTYHIWYYNSDGNLITFIDKEGHEASGVVGEQGYFTTHKDCVKLTITKTANPDLHDVSSEEILSNEVMISKGDSEQLYYPYLDSPSLVRNTNYIEFNGNENWVKRENNNHTFTLSIVPKIARGGICSHYPSMTQSQIDVQNGIYLLNIEKIVITDMRYDTLEDFKAFLVEQYRNGTPVTAAYWLNEGTTTQLTDDQTNALKSLTTYELMSNVFTNNQIKGESSFSYVSDITEQQTENAYVQLKCYNMNKIPYYIHSNYIDIPEDKSKVFIWLRRKNNLFDLKIEDLGDYSGDEPGDKNKPKVSLDIDMKDVTSTEIPVIAHSIDETGLKTVRFSKDNGESWDEVITVDGLSSTNSYTFEGLTPGTTYPIRVEAIDISGNIGGITQEVTTKVV